MLSKLLRLYRAFNIDTDSNACFIWWRVAQAETDSKVLHMHVSRLKAGILPAN